MTKKSRDRRKARRKNQSWFDNLLNQDKGYNREVIIPMGLGMFNSINEAIDKFYKDEPGFIPSKAETRSTGAVIK